MAAKKTKSARKVAVKKRGQTSDCGEVDDKDGCGPSYKDCPKTVEALCQEMRTYMRCMCEWGVDIVTEIELLKADVAKCCDGGPPGNVKRPPPPPF